jgi:hypothetical protein
MGTPAIIKFEDCKKYKFYTSLDGYPEAIKPFLKKVYKSIGNNTFSFSSKKMLVHSLLSLNHKKHDFGVANFNEDFDVEYEYLLSKNGKISYKEIQDPELILEELKEKKFIDKVKNTSDENILKEFVLSYDEYLSEIIEIALKKIKDINILRDIFLNINSIYVHYFIPYKDKLYSEKFFKKVIECSQSNNKKLFFIDLVNNASLLKNLAKDKNNFWTIRMKAIEKVGEVSLAKEILQEESLFPLVHSLKKFIEGK